MILLSIHPVHLVQIQFNVSQEILIQNGVNGGGGRRLNAFAKSLARCEMWHPSGGKSGTTFYKTKDDR